jgi:hypothetical protein
MSCDGRRWVFAPEKGFEGPELGKNALNPTIHGEFINYAAVGIWNRPWQWCCHA